MKAIGKAEAKVMEQGYTDSASTFEIRVRNSRLEELSEAIEDFIDTSEVKQEHDIS